MNERQKKAVADMIKNALAKRLSDIQAMIEGHAELEQLLAVQFEGAME